MSEENSPLAGLADKVEPIATCYVRTNCDFITKLVEELPKSVSSGLSDLIPNSANEVLEGLSELVSSGLSDLIPNSANEVLKGFAGSVSSGLSNLIPNANEVVSVAIEASLWHAYDAAEFTQSRDDSVEKEIMGWKLPEVLRLSKRKEFNKIAVAVIGGAGGAGGLPVTMVELPATVGLIFREIQLVWKDYNKNGNLASCEAKQECLSVFLLGTSLEGDNTTDSEFIVPKVELPEPTVQCLITEIVPKLVKVLAPKLISQPELVSPPVAGAANAVLHVIYFEHYRELACVKFRLAELSRSYDPVCVQEEFKRQVEAHRCGCR